MPNLAFTAWTRPNHLDVLISLKLVVVLFPSDFKQNPYTTWQKDSQTIHFITAQLLFSSRTLPSFLIA